GGVGRTDVDQTVQFPFGQFLGDEHGLDVGLHAHLLGDLDEDELIAPVLIACSGQFDPWTHEPSWSCWCSGRIAHPRSVMRSVTATAFSTAPGRSECRQMVSARIGDSTPSAERTMPARMPST